MTEHLLDLIAGLVPLNMSYDPTGHVLTYTDGPCERAVWDTGRAMLPLLWDGVIWELESQRLWSREAVTRYEAACDTLQSQSRRLYAAEASAAKSL